MTNLSPRKTPAVPHATLSADRIRNLLDDRVAGDLSVLDVVDSTSAWLLERAGQPDWHASCCTARAQKAGRGRRGRDWISRPQDDVVLSYAWDFTETSNTSHGAIDLSCFSLGVGVALAHVFERMGASGFGIKWPNDLLCDGRKLAGILVQTVSHGGRITGAVTGIGINVSAQNNELWMGIEELPGINTPVDRNALVAELMVELHALHTGWRDDGVQTVQQKFRAYDVLHDRTVTVERAVDTVQGVACGIDSQGALLVRTLDGTLVTLHAGDASIGSHTLGHAVQTRGAYE